jgi:hypothetical protein
LKQTSRFCPSVAAFVLSSVLLPGLPASAQKATSGAVEALEKKYVVTETTADNAQVTKDGTTMTMKCAGIYSIPSNVMMKPDNKVVDGKVQAPNTFAKYTLVKMGAHVLQTGDKVYVTKLESKSETSGDTLKFTVLTTDDLDVSGSDAKKKYTAYVSFKFPKGFLDETPPEQIEQTIESVLAPEEAAAAEPAAAPAKAQVAAAAAPAPPPPPAAPAGPPPTITIGESSTEVLKAMGMPQQMVDLGKKKTYIYKNMKIVFLDDKVSDVQ